MLLVYVQENGVAEHTKPLTEGAKKPLMQEGIRFFVTKA